jgi:hypothetical protein
MKNPSRSFWARSAGAVKVAAQKHPLLAFLILVLWFYFADCWVAHPSHPELPWLESGVYCGGPFGFVATVGLVLAGAVYAMKKGY